jgi:hypothetical protein
MSGNIDLFAPGNWDPHQERIWMELANEQWCDSPRSEEIAYDLIYEVDYYLHLIKLWTRPEVPQNDWVRKECTRDELCQEIISQRNIISDSVKILITRNTLKELKYLPEYVQVELRNFLENEIWDLDKMSLTDS